MVSGVECEECDSDRELIKHEVRGVWLEWHEDHQLFRLSTRINVFIWIVMQLYDASERRDRIR